MELIGEAAKWAGMTLAACGVALLAWKAYQVLAALLDLLRDGDDEGTS